MDEEDFETRPVLPQVGRGALAAEGGLSLHAVEAYFPRRGTRSGLLPGRIQ